MDAGFDPYHKWLGIPPEEQPPNHYRLLGISPFETDADVISHAADQRMVHVRSFQTGPKANLSQRLLNEISLARVTLLNPAQKAQYDAGLRAQAGVAAEPTTAVESAPPSPTIRVARSRPRKQANPAMELIKVVAGGAFGLFLAVLGLSYFAGIDLLGWQKKQAAPPAAHESSHSGKTSTAQPGGAKQNDPSERVAKGTTGSRRPSGNPSMASGGASTPQHRPERPAKSSSELASRGAIAPPLAVAPFNETEAKQHQQNWATYLRQPVEKEITLPGGEKVVMVLIPPGEFTRSEIDSPSFRVRLTKPFYLAKYEVTQSQWQAVTGSNPSHFRDSPMLPVESVGWDDIQPFLAKLNSGGTNGPWRFDLPTEAQWEYACRAGTTSAYSFGDSDADVPQYGWFKDNGHGKTHPAGQLKANPFGLYDLHGNVWEWCVDWKEDGYFANAPLDDPPGPPQGSLRVVRGGSWVGDAADGRRSFRGALDPKLRWSDRGFRLALNPSGVGPEAGSGKNK